VDLQGHAVIQGAGDRATGHDNANQFAFMLQAGCDGGRNAGPFVVAMDHVDECRCIR
jgi:hypothetical protein